MLLIFNNSSQKSNGFHYVEIYLVYLKINLHWSNPDPPRPSIGTYVENVENVDNKGQY